ncbi:DUF115 domain-containing protein, partial [bacterium]|nr:DUF115 domain-containing protein [bacterium]
MKPTYQSCVEASPEVEGVVSESMWNYITKCDQFTQGIMKDVWHRNAERNLKKLYPKQKSLTHSFWKFAENKALIGVGAGPSLNNNIDHLKEIFDYNLRFALDEQLFVIAASNHQFKPLLKRGIVPHFVFLTDGGDHIYDQLCKDIPDIGQATVLVASVYGDHKTLRDWARQGRYICFTIPSTEDYQNLFKEIINEDPEPLTVGSGGNVLNSMFLTGLKILHARYFMALGNDLSFPYDPDIDKRRKMFYADGDYSVNMKKGVDEAKDRFVWLGYSMRDNPFQQGEKIVEFHPVNTSRQLFIYKMWIELHVTTWGTTSSEQFIYYNCSEGGIAGVLAKEQHSKELMEDPKNWHLLDNIIPKRWRTRSFLQAVNQFMEATLLCREKGAGA